MTHQGYGVVHMQLSIPAWHDLWLDIQCSYKWQKQLQMASIASTGTNCLARSMLCLKLMMPLHTTHTLQWKGVKCCEAQPFRKKARGGVYNMWGRLAPVFLTSLSTITNITSAGKDTSNLRLIMFRSKDSPNCQ